MVTEGFEVLSTEIENALMSHPGVTEAAAIEVLHPRRGAAVHAVVTLRPHAIVAVAELMSALRERTCAGALPTTIEFGGPLPRTPRGDVDKRALRASHWPRLDGRVRAPRGRMVQPERRVPSTPRAATIDTRHQRRDRDRCQGDAAGPTDPQPDDVVVAERDSDQARLQHRLLGIGAARQCADGVDEAERLGFDSVWTAEAYGSDALTPLAWWGSRTERIRLGTDIVQLSARTPAATAMAALTLDHLSGGRFILGLGASGPQVVEGWYGQPYPTPARPNS